jgi:hypothetical protein
MRSSVAAFVLALSTFLPSGFAADKPAADRSNGVLPTSADGQPLNLDFETGTLKDWTATGDAFKDQPVKGDLVAKRRGDARSEHQGAYWIGGFEIVGDKGTGTLTSVPFKVTHPYATFLFASGPNRETRVEIVRAEDKKVILSAVGREKENLEPVLVDLTREQGKEIFIRLVDNHNAHWGHLNFDDFRFHLTAPAVPPPPRPAGP